MEFGNSSEELKSDINVTPLVDVMLVLLIIFMLITPLLQTGVTVELPQASNVGVVTDDRDEAITIAIRSTGEMLMGETTIDASMLVQTLARRYASDPSLELHIKADRNATFGAVKQVVKAGRDAGFMNAALVAEALEEDTP